MGREGNIKKKERVDDRREEKGNEAFQCEGYWGDVVEGGGKRESG